MLHVGENILLRKGGGRVRALIDDAGQRVRSAGPSTPVEILGLSEVPQSGDTFVVVRNDKEFKRLIQQAKGTEKEKRQTLIAAPGLMADTETRRHDFNVIIKADTHGSVEALVNAILQMATEEVTVKVLHAGTGDVSEADVMLASAGSALIVAFNVREEAGAQRVAQDQGVPVKSYDIIYHVTEDLEKRMLGLLAPETSEEEAGVAEVRQLFTFGKTTIAGCHVTDGKITRNAMARVFRQGKEVFKGTLNNLKRFKEDAREVAAGYECGISFDRFNDLQAGDVIRVYILKAVERTSL
jgi:translation initiation factor IF-2